MTTPFAIPGLMQPVLSPENYRAVSVVDDLDLVVLETSSPTNPVSPRVELRSRGGIFLHREDLAPQYLVPHNKAGVTSYQLKWPVDVPPNDYELHVTLGGKTVKRIAFNVAPPPQKRLYIQRQTS